MYQSTVAEMNRFGKVKFHCLKTNEEKVQRIKDLFFQIDGTLYHRGLEQYTSKKCEPAGNYTTESPMVSIDNRLYSIKRVVMAITEGYFPGPRQDGMMWINQTKNTNKSGIKGVSWDKDRLKWMATITHNYKTINLGRYDNIKDAAWARINAEYRLHGKTSDAQTIALKIIERDEQQLN